MLICIYNKLQKTKNMRNPRASHGRHSQTTHRRGQRPGLSSTTITDGLSRNVIMSGAINRVGLSDAGVEAYAANGITAESTAFHLIDNFNVVNVRMGKELLGSIDLVNDTTAMISLKQICAHAFGCKSRELNYSSAIENIDSLLNAGDLYDIITHLYELTHENGEGSNEFSAKFMSMLSGFRVEASFRRLAVRAGFNVQFATKEQDDHGIDFIVNGVPFDVKSSRSMASKHLVKHANDGNRMPTVRFIPPITADDFMGHLVVPEDQLDGIINTRDFNALVYAAIAQYNTPNVA